MKLSPESLEAFAHAASLGSFSAAARQLGKSQSTVSEAISRLEIDLGLTLFDRTGKSPVLSAAGQALLGRVEEVLSASDRLQRTASALAGGLESRLTLVLSDAYQSEHFKSRIMQLAERFPELEFECIFAENADIISLISSGRATLGLLPVEGQLLPEIGRAPVAERAEFAVYASPGHPLVQQGDIESSQLAQWRHLGLNTLSGSAQGPEWQPVSQIRSWSAPNYLILLDLAVMGFGWAVLPRWLVDAYAADKLVELTLPNWPRFQALEVVWSRKRPLGPAGNWLRDALASHP
ncbi:LysR family transcriptional regulator [Pseudomonas aestusnigri]|jgi:DNA-binding transcriptional LysR family regulator|uniref:LysR family transcriptional regulator n=1 Tax=Halopseudomonas aestusnigri TaxID=857252 RepID=UPI001D186402|nr:LysR family transcriptional regulator [Halopseudomonas aestusnigri]MCC4259122.1 LysR family transcriptional regulator [Halopseudomonas aestusnigri]